MYVLFPCRITLSLPLSLEKLFTTISCSTSLRYWISVCFLEREMVLCSRRWLVSKSQGTACCIFLTVCNTPLLACHSNNTTPEKKTRTHSLVAAVVCSSLVVYSFWIRWHFSSFLLLISSMYVKKCFVASCLAGMSWTQDARHCPGLSYFLVLNHWVRGSGGLCKTLHKNERSSEVDFWAERKWG